jgi:hypothetical protein
LSAELGPIPPTIPGSGYANAYIPQQVIHDLAGNSSNAQGPYATPIDNVPPTITAGFSASGSTFTVGQSVQINYSCGDNSSGVALCAGQAASPACQLAPASGPLTYGFSSPIDTSAGQIGTHSFSVTSTDCAGNLSAQFKVSYTIAAPAVNLALLATPSENIKEGTTGVDYPILLDLSTATAYDVVVTTQFTIPSGVLSGNLTATYWIGPCTVSGCPTNPISPVACNVSGTTVICDVGTLLSVFKGQGVIVKINIPVSSTAAGQQFTAVTKATSASSSAKPVNQTFKVTK